MNSSNCLILILLTALLLSCASKAPHPWRLPEPTRERYQLPEFTWDDDFKEVQITSSLDSVVQGAYFYRVKENEPRPLLVHLHTWRNNYTKADPMADMVRDMGWNYIHPNFRGYNNHPQACCSPFSIQDIDDAISFALENANVDSSKIYVAGYSGGGMATLCTFMKSKHKVAGFSAWASISDLEAWYRQALGHRTVYGADILNITSSKDSVLNVEEARKRSPLYMDVPLEKLEYTKLKIYAGIRDGFSGSVPITHSIKFYNKVIRAMGADSTHLVPYEDAFFMLENKMSPEPKRDLGKLNDREILYLKEYKNVRLIIFDGTHEALRMPLLKEIEQ